MFAHNGSGLLVMHCPINEIHNMSSVKAFSLVLFLSTLFTSCFQEVEVDKISGDYKDDVGLAIPAVRSRFTLKDIVAEIDDSTEIYLDSAARQRMRFVHVEDPLISIDVVDLLDIGAGEFSGSVKISDVDIPDFLSFEDSITVVDIAEGITNPLLKAYFESSLGTPTTIPSIPGVNIGTYKIWESEGIKSISFTEGIFDITVINNMQLTLDFIATFEDADGQLLIEKVVTDFKSGEEFNVIVDAAGMDIAFPVTLTISELKSDGGEVTYTEESGLKVNANLRDVIFNTAELQIKDEIQGESNDTIAYNDKDKVLQELKFAGGQLSYSITNMSSIDELDVDLLMPEFIKGNGENIRLTEKLKENIPASGTIDLAGAALKLENTDIYQGETLLRIMTDITVHPTSDTIIINYNDSIYGEFTITDVELSSAKGWFGKETIEIEEEKTELWLDFFGEELENLTMTNPRFIFTVTNSFGISCNLDLAFKGVDKDGINDVDIDLSPKYIAQPKAGGESVRDIILDRDSVEGLVDLVNLPPATVYHSGTIVVNPGDTVRVNEFDESDYFSLGMRFEMPFEFAADSFVYEDTLVFEWPDDTEDLYPRYLTVAALHNLPFYLMSEFVFLDEYDQPTDTVTGTIIDPAPSDENGFSTDSILSHYEIGLTQEESESLKASQSIIMKSIIYTGARGSAREIILQATDYADVQIGVKGVYKLED